MRVIVLACLLVVPCAAAQEVQLSPPEPAPGEPVLLQTTVLGNVSWDFGDGRTATGRSVSHTFPYPGIYHVTVYQGQVAAATTDVVVRIPEELYLDAVTAPTNGTTPPPAPANKTYTPPEPPGGFLHYLTEHPFVLILVLGAGVGAVMAGVFFVRKKNAKGESYDEDDQPSPPPPPKPDEAALEELLPGVEDPPEPDEAEAEPVAEETPQAEVDPLSLGENAPAEPKKADFDRDALFKKLGGSP